MDLKIQDNTLVKVTPRPHQHIINVPRHITAIADGAFEGCALLTRVYIPETLTSIGAHAFRWCFKLEHLRCTESQSQFFLPDSLTAIGEEAFTGCSRMEELSVPDSLEQLGRHAVRKCPNLRYIRIRKPNDPLRLLEPGRSDLVLEMPRYLPNDLRCTDTFLDTAFGRYDEMETLDELLLAVERFTTVPDHILTELWLAGHMDQFFSEMEATGTMALLHENAWLQITLPAMLRSDRILANIPERFLEELIIFANEQKAYDLQLRLINRKQNFDGYAETIKRFTL